MESIYGAIHSYIPTSNRNPREDYLTEILAWSFRNIEGFARRFTDELLEKTKGQSSSVIESVSTQVNTNKGRIDLVIETTKSIWVFEHKVDAWLRDNQIQDYVQAMSQRDHRKIYSVLISRDREQHTQMTHIHLCWYDVYEYIERTLDSYHGSDRFMLNQLKAYLDEEGLGPMKPVTANQLRSIYPAKELRNQLPKILNRLLQKIMDRDDTQFRDFFPESVFAPKVSREKWGRLGIDFYQEWHPGFFAGVILDGSDHQIYPEDESRGPDFAFMIDVIPERMHKDHEHSVSKLVLGVESYLEKNSGTFMFMRQGGRNPYHRAILKKPMMDILSSCNTFNDQVDALEKEFIAAWKLYSEAIRASNRQKQEPFRMINWNIQQGGRKDRIKEMVDAIVSRNPDFVLLTEFRANQRGELIIEHLSNQGYPYCLSSEPKGNDNGLLMISRKPIALNESSAMRADAEIRWMDVYVPEKDMSVLGVHIPNVGEKWDKDNFWNALVAFGEKCSEKKYLVVGDFNTGLPEDTEHTAFSHQNELRAFQAQGWVDGWRSKHPDRREYTWYSHHGNGFRIDYLYFSPALKGIKYEIEHVHSVREDKLSDHSMLVADIHL